MTTSEIVLVCTTLLAIATAVAGIIRDRRKPQLDEAQAEHVLVNSDSVKAEIRKMSDTFNARRDLRVLELEDWAFNQVRPWGRDVVKKFDQVTDLLRDELWDQEKNMPDIKLLPFPEMPAPHTT